MSPLRVSQGDDHMIVQICLLVCKCGATTVAGGFGIWSFVINCWFKTQILLCSSEKRGGVTRRYVGVSTPPRTWQPDGSVIVFPHWSSNLQSLPQHPLFLCSCHPFHCKERNARVHFPFQKKKTATARHSRNAFNVRALPGCRAAEEEFGRLDLMRMSVIESGVESACTKPVVPPRKCEATRTTDCGCGCFPDKSFLFSMLRKHDVCY